MKSKKPKKKPKKMDPKLVSKEDHEIAYLAKKHKVSRKLVRLAKQAAGRSRSKIAAFIEGYKSNLDDFHA